MRFLLAGIVGLTLLGSAGSAEISSNGLGGGAWSDPETWRGKVVPGTADDVVVRKHDIVVYDQAGSTATASCRKLLVDPKGILLFKTNAGKLILSVAEGVETFGTIKLDGTKSATDFHELRLLGQKADTRRVKIGRGGGLLLYGKPGLPEARKNVALTALPATEAMIEVPALVDTDGMVTIDWQRASVAEFKLVAKNLDNTGAKPNERINVIDCQFTGRGRIYCEGCDSPILNKNVLGPNTLPQLQEPALHVNACPLAEIKNNQVAGGFLFGFGIYRSSDVVFTGNRAEKVSVGVSGGYGIPNFMVKQLQLHHCETGLRLEGSPGGVLEDVDVIGATTAMAVENCSLQLTQFRIKELNAKGVGIHLHLGTLRVQGGTLTPYDFKVTWPAGTPPPPMPTLVVATQNFKVDVKDAPAGALVEVRTSDPKLAAEALDANVRNSPAALVNGSTLAPNNFVPLNVKTWGLDFKGELTLPPTYVVKVLGPAASEGAARPVLKSVTFTPPPPSKTGDDPIVRLEVSLK